MDRPDVRMKDIHSSRHSRIKTNVAAGTDIEGLKRLMQENFDQLDRKLKDEFDRLQKALYEERAGLSKACADNAPGRETFLSYVVSKISYSPMPSAGDDREISRLKEKELLLRSERDRLRSDNDDLRRINRELEQELRQLEAQNQAIDRLHGFKGSCAGTGERPQAGLAEQLEDLQRQKEDMMHQYRAMEQENRSLQEQTATFRSMIIRKGSKEIEQVDDATICRQFSNLRAQIQRIVHKHYQADPRKQPTMARTASDPHELLKYWGQGLSSSQIQNRLRAELFSTIYEEFLSVPTFGLEDLDSTGELESGLVRFEKALQDVAPGQEHEVSEWRAQTTKCASLLEKTSSKPERVAQYLQDIMAPVVKESSPESSRAKGNLALCELYLSLCRDAFNFSLLLRRCRDLYKCEVPARGNRLVSEDADAQDREPCLNNITDHSNSHERDISFALYGALVKYPELSPQARLVLEKAHVVVYQK